MNLLRSRSMTRFYSFYPTQIMKITIPDICIFAEGWIHFTSSFRCLLRVTETHWRRRLMVVIRTSNTIPLHRLLSNTWPEDFYKIYILSQKEGTVINAFDGPSVTALFDPRQSLLYLSPLC